MPSINQLIINESRTRISKEISPEVQTIFLNHVGDKPILDRDDRKAILSVWHKKWPAIKLATWRVYLHRLENQFFEAQPKYSQNALINKITIENEELKSQVMAESTKDITIKAKTINDLNELTAKVNKLTDAPPAVNVLIETSINEDELTRRIVDNFKRETAIDIDVEG